MTLKCNEKGGCDDYILTIDLGNIDNIINLGAVEAIIEYSGESRYPNGGVPSNTINIDTSQGEYIEYIDNLSANNPFTIISKPKGLRNQGVEGLSGEIIFLNSQGDEVDKIEFSTVAVPSCDLTNKATANIAVSCVCPGMHDDTLFITVTISEDAYVPAADFDNQGFIEIDLYNENEQYIMSLTGYGNVGSSVTYHLGEETIVNEYTNSSNQDFFNLINSVYAVIRFYGKSCEDGNSQTNIYTIRTDTVDIPNCDEFYNYKKIPYPKKEINQNKPKHTKDSSLSGSERNSNFLLPFEKLNKNDYLRKRKLIKSYYDKFSKKKYNK